MGTINLSNNQKQTIQTTQENKKYYPVHWFQKNNEDHIVLVTDHIFYLDILDYNLNTKTFTKINKKLSTGEKIDKNGAVILTKLPKCNNKMQQ